MDDAFTLLRRAAALLPDDITAAHGQTVGDVRAEMACQEWELAVDLLAEIGDIHPAPSAFWEMLAEAARQMALDPVRSWCTWRAWEARHGTVRATLTLLRTDEGGRRGSFFGDGRLRPLWDIGHRTGDGRRDLDIARLWVEDAPQLGPGETAGVRLAPLRPERWRHLTPGDVITMHEADPAVASAEIVEVRPPSG
ncbi:hypothetical protein ACPA54_04645 [Uniformispora flossi]|uniref:hypothetical protein n=1 Tax=Uniformispora flossi TaxID=3390723 RepID=UPI003C2BBFC7